MKNFNIDMRIGLGALLCFIASWLVISSPVLSSRLSYWLIKNDKELTENADLARRICSRHHRILYGIFTMAHKSETRAVVRQQTQCDFDNDMSQVVFVVGMPATDKEFETISRESKMYNDIFVLTCEENMNYGKSYTYFKEALEKLPCFDFYAKVDDDTAFDPVKMSNKIAGIPDNTSLLIGRIAENKDTDFLGYTLKSIQFFLHDMSWIYHVKRYTAGMFYILNSRAVRVWIELNPVDFYGDEDMRTSYYMNQVGARVVDFGDAFHDYIKYKTSAFQGHWRRDITNESLAVHQYKLKQDLNDAFASICAI
jgi:hypothetical protein